MEHINFNADWIFYTSENPGHRKKVHLPHDAMQLEARVPRLKNGALVGFYPGGDYYYEKEFIGSDELAFGTVMLEFGGVFMKSHVYLNGEETGGHVYGYSNFYVNLTGKILHGEKNQLQIFVQNSQIPNSRWYSGAGIYRPVSLLVGSEEYIVPDGIKIITKSYEPAIVEVFVESVKECNTEIFTEILWDGVTVASGKGEQCEIQLPDARLWDDHSPALYEYRITLIKQGKQMDSARGKFGIRKLEWNSRCGLMVNGKSRKLRGGCVHHDNGIIGAHESKAACLRRIRKLKAAGFNAIRCSHNPASRELMEACDELGMYIMAEIFDGWFTNGTYGYVLYFEKEWKNDLRLAVRNAWNHPSVIMYSIGNEVAETACEKGLCYAKKMVEAIHELDDSRPVTMGVNLMMNTMQKKIGFKLGGDGEQKISPDDVVDPKSTEPGNLMDGSVLFNFLISVASAAPFIRAMSKPKRSDAGTEGIFGMLDIAGYNYGEEAYLKHHEMHPERIIVGTETKPLKLKSRISTVRRMSCIIGDFCWTAWDYLGECGLGIIDYNKNLGSFVKPYPAITAGCGLFDITGHRETMAYDMAIAWGLYKKPYIAVSHPKHAADKMIPSMYRTTDGIDSWSFEGYENVMTTVRVASIGYMAEVIINGISYGKKRLKEYIAVFKVPYIPGNITVVSYDRKKCEIERKTLCTAGSETVLQVICDKDKLKADGEDLAYIDITLTDQNGIYKPLEKKITVKVEGSGSLLGIGSGNPRTEESYTGSSFTSYNGRITAVIRAAEQAGDIKITVSSNGLSEQIVYLTCEEE